MALRNQLIQFLGDFSQHDLRTDSNALRCAQNMLSAIWGESATINLLDSFAGGGSIPIEGQLLGYKSYATDINPIPILLNKLQLEVLPDLDDTKYEQIRLLAEEINEDVEQELSEIYSLHNPLRSTEFSPIGYLCSRTIICEGAGCGVKYPLLKSNRVSKKQKLNYNFSLSEDSKNLTVQIVNSPKTTKGNVDRWNATCPICQFVTPSTSVKSQLISKQGGANDCQLLAVVCQSNVKKGKYFFEPNNYDHQERILAASMIEEFSDNINYARFIPNQRMIGNSRYLTPPSFGMEKWSDAYTPRQLLSTIFYSKKVSEIQDEGVKLILGLATSKYLAFNTSLSPWRSDNEAFNEVFKSHDIRMTYDFYEARPFGKAGASWLNNVDNTLKGLKKCYFPPSKYSGVASYCDATNHFLPDNSIDIWAVDPPYYDSIPYSDVSNYYVTILQKIFPDLVLEGNLSPRISEVVMDKTKIPNGEVKSKDWYEKQVTLALSEGLRVTKPEGIAYWVYAHKSTKGWATVLKGIMASGWKITSSWPIQTELTSRARALDSATLSTSVHIVMRPRPNDAGVGEWNAILKELPNVLNSWLNRMNESRVMGADAMYSCIGPAMELYSKYNSVERASGELIGVDEYLDYVWLTVADEAIKMIDAKLGHSGTEPAVRFSIVAIWALRQSKNIHRQSGQTLADEVTGVNEDPSEVSLPFDTASMLARSIGVVLDELDVTNVIHKNKSTVKILSPEDRRHYLLGIANARSEVYQKVSDGIQMKLGESQEEAEVRVDIETKQKGLIEMPKRDSQLDKLHQAMLLHADGNSVALESHLRDNIGDDPAVWHLAQTLNTLYPEGSWERSKIEGVIARHQSLR
jgi:adenine-specific DNA methylase